MPNVLKKKFGQNFLIDGNILNKIKQLIPHDQGMVDSRIKY